MLVVIARLDSDLEVLAASKPSTNVAAWVERQLGRTQRKRDLELPPVTNVRVLAVLRLRGEDTHNLDVHVIRKATQVVEDGLRVRTQRLPTTVIDADVLEINWH